MMPLELVALCGVCAVFPYAATAAWGWATSRRTHQNDSDAPQ